MAKERRTTQSAFFLAASAILAAGLLGVLVHFHSKRNA